MPTTTGAMIHVMEEQEKNQGTLPEILSFYKSLLELQDRVARKIGHADPVISPEFARARRLAGEPLLSFNEIPFNREELILAFQGVLQLVDQFPGLFKPVCAAIRKIAPGQVMNNETLDDWFLGKPVVLPVAATVDEQAFLEAVFNMTFKPFLSRQANAVAKYLIPEEWRRGYCPVCGGNPDFAFLSCDGGSRHLVCSRCDTEWLYQRLQCPYCNNYDPKQLSYFTDEQSAYRLYICEPCGRYLKAVDLRLVNGEVHMPLERLLTLDIDRQAREKGYH